MFVDGPLVLSGYSFGADVSLCVFDPRITGWYAVAPPLRSGLGRRLRGGDRSSPQAPRGSRARPVQLARRGASHNGRVGAATEVTCIPGADHFLNGRLSHVADGCVDFAALLGMKGRRRCATAFVADLRSRFGRLRARFARQSVLAHPGGALRRPTSVTVTRTVKSGGYGAVTVRVVSGVVARRHREGLRLGELHRVRLTGRKRLAPDLLVKARSALHS